jgi:hypothetical protein
VVNPNEPDFYSVNRHLMLNCEETISVIAQP